MDEIKELVKERMQLIADVTPKIERITQINRLLDKYDKQQVWDVCTKLKEEIYNG